MAHDAPLFKRPIPVVGLFVCIVLAAVFIYLDVQKDVIRPGDEISFSGATMGTTYTVKFIAGDPAPTPPEFDAMLADFDALLADINGKMSTYDPNSELSRFNASQSTEAFPISAETYEVIEAAIQVSDRSEGAFDITAGPLINAWGFGPDKTRMNGPDDEELEALKKRVGYQKLTLRKDPPSIAKRIPDVYCDLSAIAKGYAVDRVAELLKEDHGIENFMVEIGGEVRAHGVNRLNTPWRIAIKTPVWHSTDSEAAVSLNNQSMATSGDYENYYEVNGQRLSHTIDPDTGRPITHTLASVSVVHESCMWADAYATAINVLGPERGKAFAEENGLAAFFIVRNESGEFVSFATGSFEDLLNATANAN